MAEQTKEKRTRKSKAANYTAGLAAKLTPVQDEYLKSVLKNHFKESASEMSAFDKEIFAGIAAQL